MPQSWAAYRMVAATCVAGLVADTDVKCVAASGLPGASGVVQGAPPRCPAAPATRTRAAAAARLRHRRAWRAPVVRASSECSICSEGTSGPGSSIAVIVGHLLGLTDRDPAQQGRQASQAGQFLTALRAVAQVNVHHGALGRIDRPQHVDTERVPDVAAVR